MQVRFLHGARYLDPPFNSNASYNVLFAAKDGTQAAAQIQVFEDTWRWDESAARQFAETVEAGGSVADVLLAFERFLGTNDMLAYLAMMAPRLVELRRVLKPTGSLYLHCDPTASHYLKLLLDAVFGPELFRNEIVWRRTRGHNDSRITKFGANHDVVLYYGKTDSVTFNRIFTRRDDDAPVTHDLYRHPDGIELAPRSECLQTLERARYKAAPNRSNEDLINTVVIVLCSSRSVRDRQGRTL